MTARWWVSLALLAVLSRPAVAAPPEPYFLGEPWEPGIVAGVEDQRRDERRRAAPDSLVARAERAAQRDVGVVKLYLLARAYGLRAQAHREQEAAASSTAVRERLRRAAQGDHASAVATYRDLLAQAPRCYFAHHDLGVLELMQQPPDRRLAFEHFSRAYRINGRYTPSQRQLVNLYFDGKQYEVAIPLLQRLVEMEPEDDQARARLALAYAELGRYDEAGREVETLLRRAPEASGNLALRARLDAATGRYDRAIETYRHLARANPNTPLPFVGILDCLRTMTKKGVEGANEDYLFALKGMRRLAREPKQQAEIAAEIEKVEYAMAQPEGGAPGEPPTLAQLVHALGHPDERMRVQALLHLMLSRESLDRGVIQKIAGRLSPAAEPVAAVRGGAVRALGRLAGTALLPLLRHALDDPQAGVRSEAADTLVGIAVRDPRAAGPVIAILGLHVRDPELEVASAARLGILRLAGVTLPGLTEASDERAHREAFEAWWTGAQGENAIIEALGAYHRIHDSASDQILVGYLPTPSFFVFRAVYEALRTAAGTAADGIWKRWYDALPRFDEAQLQPENGSALRSALQRWVAGRPGA